MLDADDAIHPSYVDVTMGGIRKTKEYVYTDVKFIGDAFHSIEMENYERSSRSTCILARSCSLVLCGRT
jgi:hypothetical protein